LFINHRVGAGPIQWPGYGQAIWGTVVAFQPGGADLFSKASRVALGPNQLPVQWELGFFPRGEKIGERSRILTTPSANVKNEWNYTISPTYAFMAHTEKTVLLQSSSYLMLHGLSYWQYH
jgi:hypothetical protein